MNPFVLFLAAVGGIFHLALSDRVLRSALSRLPHDRMVARRNDDRGFEDEPEGGRAVRREWPFLHVFARSGPGLDFPIVDAIEPGDLVAFRPAMVGDWIDTDRGWLYASRVVAFETERTVLLGED